MCRLKLLGIFILCLSHETHEATGKSKFLISTARCKIPNINMTFVDDDMTDVYFHKRRIFINKIGENKIQFLTQKRYRQCCFSFIYRSNFPLWEDREVQLSPCKAFTNNTVETLLTEFIKVECTRPRYEDYYALVKKVDGIADMDGDSWNILMIGIDSMSRAHAYQSLKQTTKYFNDHEWLDFRGFNKVGYNSEPNLLALLTGTKGEWLRGKGCQDVSACLDYLIWQDFKKSGYVTAFGEDTYDFPTFLDSYGFRSSPTHHYMKPLFVAGETKRAVNVRETGRMLSAQQILDYIFDYTNTYKNKKYFGFFFMSSVSHGTIQHSQVLDAPFEEMFTKLHGNGLMRNTFVIFFADHGVNFGPMRSPADGFYEERLPMLFIWLPPAFREEYTQEFLNLRRNQHCLTSAYDMYLTLFDLLKISTNTKRTFPRIEPCPNCVSLLTKIPESRSCEDAGIPDHWCACHAMHRIFPWDNETTAVVRRVRRHLKNLSKSFPMKRCTRCVDIQPGALIRINSFLLNGYKNFITVVMTNPSNTVYEVAVRRKLYATSNFTYEVVATTCLTSQAWGQFCHKEAVNRGMCKCIVDLQCIDRIRNASRSHNFHSSHFLTNAS